MRQLHLCVVFSFNLQCSKKTKMQLLHKNCNNQRRLGKEIEMKKPKKKQPKLAKCPSNEMCNRIHNLFGAQLPPPLPGCTLHLASPGTDWGLLWHFLYTSSSSSTAENAPQTITYKLLNCIIAPVESVFGFYCGCGCCCCCCFCWG